MDEKMKNRFSNMGFLKLMGGNKPPQVTIEEEIKEKDSDDYSRNLVE